MEFILNMKLYVASFSDWSKNAKIKKIIKLIFQKSANWKNITMQNASEAWKFIKRSLTSSRD